MSGMTPELRAEYSALKRSLDHLAKETSDLQVVADAQFASGLVEAALECNGDLEAICNYLYGCFQALQYLSAKASDPDDSPYSDAGCQLQEGGAVGGEMSTPWTRAAGEQHFSDQRLVNSDGLQVCSAATPVHADQILRAVNSHAVLAPALRNLLAVIAEDNLIPESVSYMREARAAIDQAERSAQP